jgi:hypothetical protein
VLDLLLSNPLWIVLATVTVGVHVGFAIAIRRMIRKDSARLDPPREP